MSSNPLVTFCFMTYNQESYVGDALRSVLEQDYKNLEIIISDDCSSDKTWDIIEEIVSEYGCRGCQHQLILNRNRTNLGISAHWALLETMCHGELKFMAAGDDISLPNRASRVVDEWVKNGKFATCVIHSGYEIDTDGNRLGVIRPTSLKSPMGAVMAWKRFPELTFKNIASKGVEDVIYAARARMLGEELIIPDKLLLYRVGSGLSTGLTSQREPAARGYHLWKQSFQQIYSDLETVHDVIGEMRYEELRVEYMGIERNTDARISLIESQSFCDRLSAFLFLTRSCRSLAGLLLMGAYLLPKNVGDFLLNRYVAAKFNMKRRLAK